MDNIRFTYIQDRILKLNSRSLATLIGSSEPAISSYRSGKREIPEYIANAMDTQAGIKIGTMTFPLAINDLIQLSRRAEASGQTVEEYIIDLLRSDGARLPSVQPVNPVTPVNPVPTVRPLYVPADIVSSRLNEDPADPDAPRKQPA